MAEKAPLQLTRAQIAELITTVNPLGSFAGERLPSLQQDNLDPGEYTLQFQIVEPPIDGLGFATYAYVVWKVAGQQISRIVNVFNGSVISGVSDSVHVQLQDQSGRGNGLFLTATFNVTNGSTGFTTNIVQPIKSGQLIQFESQPNVFYTVLSMNGTAGILDTAYTGTTHTGVNAFTLSKYKVAVALSRGTRATTMQPPVLFTTKAIVVTQSSSAVIFFPPADAGVLSILVTTISTNNQAENGVVGMLDATSATLAAYFPSEFSGWYPVPPGTVSIEFTNQSTTQSIEFSIQWGIEG